MEEARADLKKALLDKIEAEAELKVNNEPNIVSPMEEKEQTPILDNPNKCTNNLHYTLDGVRRHFLVEPEGGIFIILTSKLADNFHYIDNKEENKAK